MLFFVLLSACAPATDTGEPPYTFTLTLDPDPPVAGPCTLGVAAPGAESLAIEAEMNGMGHGFSEEPIVEGGAGEWDVAVEFSMSGEWTLWFDLDGEGGAARIERVVEVE